MKHLIAYLILALASMQAHAVNPYSAVYNKANHKIIQQHMMTSGGYSFSSTKKLFDNFNAANRKVRELKKKDLDTSAASAERKTYVQKIAKYIMADEDLMASMQMKDEGKPVQRYVAN